MIFFFKVVTGTVRVSLFVLPQVLVTRTTRSNSNRNVTHFTSRKCNTVTFQGSFFNRTTSNWNTLANDLQLSCNLQISQFKSIMYKYQVDPLGRNYDPDNPRSWKPSVRHVTFHVTSSQDSSDPQLDLFVPNTAEGLMQAGLSYLNQLIQTFVYCVLRFK